MTMQPKIRSQRRGAAMVEFALTVPLIFILCMAATDFGRLFFHGVTAMNAALTGSYHGAHNVLTAAQVNTRESRSLSDGGDLDGLSADATVVCDCPDDDDADSDPQVVSCDLADDVTACPAYGAPRVFARTEVNETFSTFGDYPLIPQNTAVRRVSFIRVQ